MELVNTSITLLALYVIYSEPFKLPNHFAGELPHVVVCNTLEKCVFPNVLGLPASKKISDFKNLG